MLLRVGEPATSTARPRVVVLGGGFSVIGAAVIPRITVRTDGP